jgi:glyoxylase-like metal-dependent hydrolase (beta-lactamase superfamily II)
VAGSEQRRADDELRQQLAQAAADGIPVEAVFVLRSPPGRPAPDPAQTDALARELVDRVRRSTGHSPQDVNVFRNLGRFVVSADATFVRELLAQPEIDAAIANRRPPEQRLQT